MPNVIGETYDISFYAKVASGTQPFSVPLRFEDQTYGKTLLSSTLSTSWKKYSFTYISDGKKNDETTHRQRFACFVCVVKDWPETHILWTN